MLITAGNAHCKKKM